MEHIAGIYCNTVARAVVTLLSLLLLVSPSAAQESSQSCIAEFAKNPCGLLKEELVRAALSEAPEKLEQKEFTRGVYMCNYRWPSDRVETVEILGQSAEVAQDNQLGISFIRTAKKNAEERFRRSYLATEEEQKRAKLMFQKQFEKQKKEQGLSGSKSKIADMLSSKATKTVKYTEVPDVGTLASWKQSKQEGRLYVLDGDTQFQVNASVSTDETVNREAAVRLANLLLAACK